MTGGAPDRTAGKAFISGFMGCLGVIAALAVLPLAVVIYGSIAGPHAEKSSPPGYVEPAMKSASPVQYGPSSWSQGVNGVGDIEFVGTAERATGVIRISCAAGRIENVMFDGVAAMGDHSGEGAVTITSSAPGLGMMAVVIGRDGVWNVRTDAEQRDVGRLILTAPRVLVKKAGGGEVAFSTSGLAPLRAAVQTHCGE